jgi:hypothetical protein
MKYQKLGEFLDSNARNGCLELMMSFEDIERFIDDGLPQSAFRYEAWWAYGDSTHPQSLAWTSAGYQPHPDLEVQRVLFALKAF